MRSQEGMRNMVEKTNLREWLNSHEADVNMNMFTRGVAGASQRERRNKLLKTGEKGSSIQ